MFPHSCHHAIPSPCWMAATPRWRRFHARRVTGWLQDPDLEIAVGSPLRHTAHHSTAAQRVELCGSTVAWIGSTSHDRHGRFQMRRRRYYAWETSRERKQKKKKHSPALTSCRFFSDAPLQRQRVHMLGLPPTAPSKPHMLTDGACINKCKIILGVHDGSHLRRIICMFAGVVVSLLFWQHRRVSEVGRPRC